MDSQTLRNLAFKTLRLAEGTSDQDEAMQLRLRAADYLERSGQVLPAQQQQQSQPPREDTEK